MHTPVENYNKLFRDSESGAIINKDVNAATAARLARDKFKNNQLRLTNLESEISNIKRMLIQLLEK